MVLTIKFAEGSTMTMNDLNSVEVYEGENVTIYDETNIQSFRVKHSADYVFVSEKGKLAATAAAISCVIMPFT